MARIKTGQRRNHLSSLEYINHQTRAGKVVPIISNTLFNSCLFGDDHTLLRDYASYLNYPDHHIPELGDLTQYASVIDRVHRDSMVMKNDYLNWVKSRLYERAERDGYPPGLLDEAEAAFDEVDFSGLCQILGYPRFGPPHQDPFLILAQLPLPIFITTGYHGVLEAALQRVGKAPKGLASPWTSEMRGEPSPFDGGYQPTVAEPLVFHLLGHDVQPAGMVLTQDNFMEFLVTVSQDMGRRTDLIPACLRHALTNCSLMLLGYDLDAWEFRALYWSLLHHRIRKQTSVSVLKLKPGDFKQDYNASYLNACAFEVHWGDVPTFLQGLAHHGDAP